MEKPILDELQWDEIEQNILLAMEFADYVRIEVWHGGFFKDHYGMIHRVDEINRTLYLETKDGKMIKIGFSDIIGAFAENT